jgi:hypothetical protein
MVIEIVIEKRSGKVEKELVLPTRTPVSIHGQFRHVLITRGGDLQMAHLNLGEVVEYTPESQRDPQY